MLSPLARPLRSLSFSRCESPGEGLGVAGDVVSLTGVGVSPGLAEAELEGPLDGSSEGLPDGPLEGSPDGSLDGSLVGSGLGVGEESGGGGTSHSPAAAVA